jgi:uncharacterized MAPEG superfamily protein
MNALTIGWLVSRVVYTYVYIWHQGTEKLGAGESPLRSKVWSVGAMICMSMFIMAGMGS